MKIELSRDEYLNLVKLVYLGNWVVNAIRTEDFDTGANEIEQKILSYAKDQNYENLADYISDDNMFYPSVELEQLVSKDLDAYDDENFWNSLSNHLGTRDFIQLYSQEEIEAMTDHERVTKQFECSDKYEDEFYNNGIERLQIVNA